MLRARGRLHSSPMAGGLCPVSAGRHVAPAPTAGPRLVVEDPTARVIGADPDAIGVAGLDLLDEGLGQAGEGVVDRVANMAVTDRHAIRGRDEFDPLARVERPIDLGQRGRICWPTVNDGVRHLAEGAADGPDPRQGLVGGGAGRSIGGCPPAMDDPAGEEPVGRIAERGEMVVEETILQFDGVQEVERVVEREFVSMVPGGPVDGACGGHVTTLILLTGYAQEVTVSE